MKKVQAEPFHVIGISVRTTNEHQQGVKDIGELWNRFFSENVAGNIPNKTNADIYAIYTDYEGDFTKPYTTIIGCRVQHLDDIPKGMTARSFEGGNYLHLTARGNLHNGLVGKKWGEIWQSDFNRAYTADFEVYGEKALNPEDAEIEFFIAIRE